MEPTIVSCLRPGRRVLLQGNLEGRVIQALIRENASIQYQVAWWDGRTRHCEWLEAFEVEPDAKSIEMPQRVGFELPK